MLIAVDIGNTKTKLSDGKNSWNFDTHNYLKSEDLKAKINEFLDTTTVECFIISSVVPAALNIWKLTFKNLYILDYHHNMFNCAYPKPEEIGTDLIASTIAAKTLYGYPNLVVDLGTATTINVLNKNDEYLGGSILPGIQTSLKSLLGNTNLLQNINIDYPKSAIGSTTEQAIQSGFVMGEVFRIEGLINKIEKEEGYPFTVITTGGWSYLVSKYLNSKYIHDPNLVLKGLFIAYKNR